MFTIHPAGSPPVAAGQPRLVLQPILPNPITLPTPLTRSCAISASSTTDSRSRRATRLSCRCRPWLRWLMRAASETADTTSSPITGSNRASCFSVSRDSWRAMSWKCLAACRGGGERGSDERGAKRGSACRC